MWATAGLGWTAPVRGGGFGGRPEVGGGGGGGVARSYGGLAAAGGRLETDSSLGLGAEAAGGPSVGGAQLGVHSVSCLTWLKLPTTFSPYTQQGDGTPRRYPLHPSVAQPYYCIVQPCYHRTGYFYACTFYRLRLGAVRDPPSCMSSRSPMLRRPVPKFSCLLPQSPYTVPRTPIQRQSTLIVAQALKPLPSSMHLLDDYHNAVSTKLQHANIIDRVTMIVYLVSWRFHRVLSFQALANVQPGSNHTEYQPKQLKGNHVIRNP